MLQSSYLHNVQSYTGEMASLGTGCPVPDVNIYYVPDMINVWILFLHLSTSLGSFRPRTFLFMNNGLDNTEWASFMSDYILNLG